MEQSDSVANAAAMETILEAAKNKNGNNDNVKGMLKSLFADSKGKLVDCVNFNIVFSGFDAVEMRKKIVSKAKVSEILLLIIVGLTRGNNILRISLSMRSTTVKRNFDAIVKQLKIVKNVSGNNGAITLSRVLACFPEAVCQILLDHEIPMAVDYSELKKIQIDYPTTARHQVCASVIPDTLAPEEVKKALAVIMVPYLLTSEVIHSKHRNWKSKSVKSRAEESEKYLLKFFNSKVVPLKDRVILSFKLGICSSSGRQLTTIWASAAEKALNWLNDKYRFSFDLNAEE